MKPLRTNEKFSIIIIQTQQYKSSHRWMHTWIVNHAYHHGKCEKQKYENF